MTWDKVARCLRARKREIRPMIGIHSLGRGSLNISLPPETIPAGWHPDTRVDAFWGRAEDEGKLRLASNARTGEFVLFRNGRGNHKENVRRQVRVDLPAGVGKARRKPVPVAYELGEDFIVLTLPDFARPPAKPSAPPVVRAPAPKAAAPARGATHSVTSRFFDDPPPGRAAAPSR